jgi:phosphoenolpyruvate synthase/pyruvate phosphate dikinase
MDLIQKFIKETQKCELWPPLNNNSLLFNSQGFTFKRYFKKYYKHKHKLSFIVLMKGSESFQLMPNSHMKESATEIFLNYLKNENILIQKRKEFEKLSIKIDRLYSKFNYKYVNSTTNEKLVKEFKEMRNIFCELNSLAWFSIFFDKEIALKVIKRIRGFSLLDLESVWDRGGVSIFNSFDVEQEKKILELIIDKKPMDYITEEIQYSDTTFHNASNLNKIKLKIKNKKLIPAKAEEMLKKINKKEEIIKQKYDSWFKKLNKNQIFIVDYLQTIIWLRDRRKTATLKELTIQWRIAQKFFKEVNLSNKLIPFCSFDEISKGVNYLKKNNVKIKKRIEGIVSLVDYNGNVIINYCDYYKFKEELNNYYLSKQNINQKLGSLKGQIGSPGKIRGIVKIILNINNSKKLQQGEILVTGMTRPEFVPLMKRSSAIITDEGGITCHAAIISRELRKPCIIGTKIATQVLKDGDMVEVDADKGIVKILQKL